MGINDTISILVPVYNVSKYIKQCIESVISQTYPYWELVLVDDGSTDESPTICDNFVNKDSRIKVIHKKNGGLASARNAGLENASGSWIMMLDGDDWISPYALQKSIDTAYNHNADFIKFSHILEYTKFSKNFSYPIIREKEEYIDALLSRSIPTSIWGGLYKRELFNKLNPKFTNGLNFGEDYSVTPRLLYFSTNPIFLQDCLYHYRVLNNSYVGSHKWSNIQQLIECEKIIFDFFSNLDNHRYKNSLYAGRIWIKKLAYDYILSNYKQNYIHYESIQELYINDINHAKCSLNKHLFLSLASKKISFRLIALLYPLKRSTISMIKTYLGMNRG